MLSSRKFLLIVNEIGESYNSVFDNLNLELNHDHRVLFNNPEKIGLVVFTGGADVSPVIYNTSQHSSTFANIERDFLEIDIFHEALKNDIPMVGICRGAQFLCVKAGGSLVQDITGHNSSHKINVIWPLVDIEEEISVSSSHHQMQNLTNLHESQYKVLGWSPAPLSKHYALSRDHVVPVERATSTISQEPDVVWYPEIKALGVQFHPEWMDNSSLGVQYFKHLVDVYIAPQIKGINDDRVREKITKTTS